MGNLIIKAKKDSHCFTKGSEYEFIRNLNKTIVFDDQGRIQTVNCNINNIFDDEFITENFESITN